ncbi:integrin alpha-X-like [Perognathus longimembris pacificus]|uniref:integrin alpha-X-like n=1 Tax=Perognathus longimembris pacificus TaxID=214514 RepID=UPI002019DCEA|nr:integrin alpha-X-like [Perognathus longimembris pacificus]
MSGLCTALLLSMGFAVSLGFNLEVENLMSFQMGSTGFGYSVVQYDSSWVVVGAPHEMKATNQRGGLYKCDYATGQCQPIQLQVPPEAVNMSLGLSLAAASNASQLLACGPTLQKECRENIHLNGLCFLLAPSFQQKERLPMFQRECPKQEQDIVFLIDGSGSIQPNDFTKMLNFVKSVMSQFQGSGAQFSLVQFSYSVQVHFTFSGYAKSSDPQSLLNNIHQQKSNTRTATAIDTVRKDVFSAEKGARTDATKILIVITDGRKYGDNKEYSEVIPPANAAGIIRYAIGVGEAFQTPESWNELNTIASSPPQDYVFNVENFDALKQIQKQLKDKIFAIEGTGTGSSSSFELEMSQEGFSAAFTPDGPVLGAVGSFDWSGGAFLHSPTRPATFINMSKENVDMRDAYLGYSTQVVLWKGARSLVMGAPRYQHTGKVVMFTQESGQWQPNAEITGTQIGSYFGASLCSVDVNGDGNTDLILIGAPHYYEQTRGGQVSVCPMPRGRAPWRCVSVLRGEQGHFLGRFGAAMTVLGDVNWDKLTDVAVGAPGEQENRGAVYIFHGTPGLGLGPAHTQRIAASQLSSSLQYFGQSLSGGQDLTRDGLVDLAVGSRGRVLLLRTRPILRVSANIRFSPAEISRTVFQCQNHQATVQTLGRADVCLHVTESSKQQLGNLQSSMTFDLALDPGRPIPRAIFKDTKTRILTWNEVLGLSSHCKQVELLLPDCVEDAVTPITLRLNFSLVGLPLSSFKNLTPMLDKNMKTYYTASLPFEKNCGADHICQDDLGVTFDFSGLQTVVVGSTLDLNVNVTVSNDGEDSYGTTVTFIYPAGLSYRRVTGSQSSLHQRPLTLTCGSAQTQDLNIRRTSCHIGHVIFYGGTQIFFLATFDVSPKAMLGDKLLMTANVTSENNSPRTSKSTLQQELPVKYAVYAVVSSLEDSTKYLNFSATEHELSGMVKHGYQAHNLGQRDLPVSIHFWVPVEVGGTAVWTEVKLHPQNPSIQCSSERIVPKQSDFRASMKEDPVLNCSIADCLRFRCDIPSFGIQEQLDFLLQGNLSFGWVSKTLQKKVLVTTVAEITFDTAVYSQLPGQEAFLRAQVKTVLENYEVPNPIPLIVGSSVGGLLLLALITAALYKVGFFNRQYKKMMEEANGQQKAVPENGVAEAFTENGLGFFKQQYKDMMGEDAVQETPPQ